METHYTSGWMLIGYINFHLLGVTRCQILDNFVLPAIKNTYFFIEKLQAMDFISQLRTTLIQEKYQLLLTSLPVETVDPETEVLAAKQGRRYLENSAALQDYQHFDTCYCLSSVCESIQNNTVKFKSRYGSMDRTELWPATITCSILG